MRLVDFRSSRETMSQTGEVLIKRITIQVVMFESSQTILRLPF